MNRLDIFQQHPQTLALYSTVFDDLLRASVSYITHSCQQTLHTSISAKPLRTQLSETWTPDSSKSAPGQSRMPESLECPTPPSLLTNMQFDSSQLFRGSGLTLRPAQWNYHWEPVSDSPGKVEAPSRSAYIHWRHANHIQEAYRLDTRARARSIGITSSRSRRTFSTSFRIPSSGISRC